MNENIVWYVRIRSTLCALALMMLGATPIPAMPIVYTDRTAFDAAVGSYRLLTLDAPDQTIVDNLTSTYSATYEGLITFAFDLQGGVFPPLTERVPMGVSGLTATARVLPPVTAFGFDVDPGLNSHVAFMEAVYPLSGLNFLGFVSTIPFRAQIESIPSPPDPSSSAFVVDNIAIQAIPEPATWLFLVVAGVALGWARWRRIGLIV